MSPVLILTARDTGQRLARVELSAASRESTAASAASDVEVFTDHRFQTFHGFGGSFTPAAAKTWLKLPPARRDEFIRAYFHPTEGNAYTLGRLAIHSCDFSDGNWTYVTDQDPALGTFSIARDRTDVIPIVRAAQAAAGAPLRLVASPWSPPAWMKDHRSSLISVEGAVRSGGGRGLPPPAFAPAQTTRRACIFSPPAPNPTGREHPRSKKTRATYASSKKARAPAPCTRRTWRVAVDQDAFTLQMPPHSIATLVA